MTDAKIPDDLRRFLLMSIDSVAHLEALLFFHRHQDTWRSAAETAQRLFISEILAAELLTNLNETGFLACHTKNDCREYQYAPVSEDHDGIVGRLAKLYARELIAVTNLIHMKTETKVQQFADAFKLKKE